MTLTHCVLPMTWATFADNVRSAMEAATTISAVIASEVSTIPLGSINEFDKRKKGIILDKLGSVIH